MAEVPSRPAQVGDLGETPARHDGRRRAGACDRADVLDCDRAQLRVEPDQRRGFNTALSVLIAGLGVLAIAYSLALFAREYRGAGAVYEYLTRGAHPAVGIFAAGIFFTGTLFLGGGGIYLGLGILTHDFWTAHISTSTVPAWWLLGLLFLALVLVLNYIGVRIAIGAMLTFAAISFTPMLILAWRSSSRAATGTRSTSSTRARPRCTSCSTA